MERIPEELSTSKPEMKRNFSVGHSRWLKIQYSFYNVENKTRNSRKMRME
jgi:hypothetical protein